MAIYFVLKVLSKISRFKPCHLFFHCTQNYRTFGRVQSLVICFRKLLKGYKGVNIAFIGKMYYF